MYINNYTYYRYLLFKSAFDNNLLLQKSFFICLHLLFGWNEKQIIQPSYQYAGIVYSLKLNPLPFCKKKIA